MPRYAAVKFTDKALAKLKPGPRRRVVFDAAEPGLGLRVGAKSRVWVFVYRAGTRVRVLTLGHYPDLTLAKARERAREERVKVDKGKDPAEEHRALKLGETFGDLAAEYVKRHAAKKRSGHEDERILNTELLPHWRHRKVREITRRDVRALIEAIADRPAPVAANRTWALVSTMFNFAIARDWLDANPASRIARQPEMSRDRVLTRDEIRQLWAALEWAREPRTDDDRPADAEGPGLRLSPPLARGLQVLLLTAQRPGEVYRMRWADLELPEDWQKDDGIRREGWWTIPETCAKNKQTHRVPIGAEVLAILREAHCTNPSDDPWVFAGIAGASVADRAKKAAAALSKALCFSFHRHDLRRTAASEMGAAGLGRETIARVLNHVDRGSRATAVYDRYEGDREKRLALDTWARRLAAILAEQPATVLPFQRRAR